MSPPLPPPAGAADAPLRIYQGFMVDSTRWQRFPLRAGDVVISTPSKSGTTWMQHIVGMLLLDTTDFGVPLSRISPWLDMLTATEDDVLALLEAQRHRRFVKTHTPLDGVPLLPQVTYVVVVRHPLDVALSDLDHDRNSAEERAVELRYAAAGPPGPNGGRPAGWEPPPEGDDPRERLLWFIDNHNRPQGSGPYGLEDLCHQVDTYWQRRHRPNVHLVHYQDLTDDRPGEMRRVAAALGLTVGAGGPDEARFAELVAAAGLDAMRSRAAVTAPEAEKGMWQDPAAFFRQGGRRRWAELLTPAEIARFEDRLRRLAGPAADWVLGGRAGRDPDADRPEPPAA